jgi:Flp pilus assembly protein TadB
MNSERETPESIEKRVDDLSQEMRFLRNTLAKYSHGRPYGYFLLVAVILTGYVAGYATHFLAGAAIIIIGVGVVAWYEYWRIHMKRAKLMALLKEKYSEYDQLVGEANRLE